MKGLQPDAFILGATVSSTEKASQWRSAIALGTRSSQTAVTPVVVNSAISACEKGDVSGGWVVGEGRYAAGHTTSCGSGK